MKCDKPRHFRFMPVDEVLILSYFSCAVMKAFAGLTFNWPINQMLIGISWISTNPVKTAIENAGISTMRSTLLCKLASINSFSRLVPSKALSNSASVSTQPNQAPTARM